MCSRLIPRETRVSASLPGELGLPGLQPALARRFVVDCCGGCGVWRVSVLTSRVRAPISARGLSGVGCGFGCRDWWCVWWIVKLSVVSNEGEGVALCGFLGTLVVVTLHH